MKKEKRLKKWVYAVLVFKYLVLLEKSGWDNFKYTKNTK